MAGFEIKDPPGDGITKVQFGGNFAQFLLASLWDKHVRLYDVNKNSVRFEYTHDLPVFDCCLIDNVYSFSGGLDCQLLMFDFNSQKSTRLGDEQSKHTKPIRCVRHLSVMNCVLTGSWDCSVKLWDVRDKNQVNTSLDHSAKVYAMDCANDKLVVGTSDRKIVAWDMRNTASPLQNKDSSLKYQTRCIKCFPNGNGYVLSSIEGRVAVEFLGNGSMCGPSDNSGAEQAPGGKMRRYAFKCHRGKTSDGKQEIVWPVNSIDFHPAHGTFATGGSDGYVHIWDGVNKKRLFQFTPYDAGVTSLAFSADGNRLAIATSYNYEYKLKGKKKPKDAIFVRPIIELECKPKPSPPN